MLATVTGPTGPTGPTGTLQYNFYSAGAGTGITGPYGQYNAPAGSAPGFGYPGGYSGQTGQSGYALAAIPVKGGPDGPMGPIANTVFYPPTVDPQIPGAVWWNPALGNTALFVIAWLSWRRLRLDFLRPEWYARGIFRRGPPMHSCRNCHAPLSLTFADLGRQPPSNALLADPDQPETIYPLHAYVCEKCWLVQLPNVVNPKEIFNDHYAYFSSNSKVFLAQCKEYAERMSLMLSLTGRPRVVEIASNDGYLLQYFKELAS